MCRGYRTSHGSPAMTSTASAPPTPTEHAPSPPNAGGLGACSVGVGGGDAVEVMAGLPWGGLYPREIARYLTRTPRGGAAPKGGNLYAGGKPPRSGGTHR